MRTLRDVVDENVREGELYERLDRNRARCFACGHCCPIPEGQPGVCKVRYNRGGTLGRSGEQRVNDVKEMLTYFMRCRGLKRLEGELNTIRLQTNSQPSLQIDDWQLPQEFCVRAA